MAREHVEGRFAIDPIPSTKVGLKSFIDQVVRNGNYEFSFDQLGQILGWMLDIGGVDGLLIVDTDQSVVGDGDATAITLSGDEAVPGNDKYYGTDNGGAKGYHDLPVSTGEANTGTSLGGGTPIFVEKIGTTLRFRSIVAGDNITLDSDGNTVTINSTAVGGGVATGYTQVAGTGFNFQADYIGSDAPTLALVGSTFTLTIPEGTLVINYQIDSSYAGVGNSETVFLKIVNVNDARYSIANKVQMHNFIIYERDTFTPTPEGTGPLFEAEAGSMALASRTKFGVYDVDEAGNAIIYQFLGFGNGKWTIVK